MQNEQRIVNQIRLRYTKEKYLCLLPSPLICFTDFICLYNKFLKPMQNFSCTGHGFMPTDLSGYFMIPPSYWTQNFPFFSFNSPVSFETPKENSLFPTLVQPFSSKMPQSSDLQQELSFLSVDNSMKQQKLKKLLSSEEERQEEQFKVKLNKSLSGVSVSYKKKNTESNIVNQTFSYLSSDRSKSVVQLYFKGDLNKVEEYYKLMIKVKQCSKKYINRKYLQRLLAFESKTEFERAFTKAKLSFLTIEEVRQTLRVLMFNFLRAQSNQTLLTSCKIYKETLPEHFWRKREIMKFLFGKEQTP